MSRQYLIIDGHDSRDYGVYISGQGTFASPDREYELIDIPGRNGALIGQERRFETAVVTYPAFIVRNFKDNIAAFRGLAASRDGYFRLEDTYHPDEYRLAIYRGGLEPDVLDNNKAGRFDVTFECKPQRFLKTGEDTVTLTATGTINNPTDFDASPLLRVYGAGVLGIGSQSITISAADVYTDIDCDIMEAYKGTTSRNAYITLSGNDFPTFAPGTTSISLGSGISRVEITPRWWRI